MHSGVSAAIDRRLADLIVVWARRRWPALRFVPARWIRPAVAPTAVRLRRSLCGAFLVAGMPVGMVSAVGLGRKGPPSQVTSRLPLRPANLTLHAEWLGS